MEQAVLSPNQLTISINIQNFTVCVLNFV